MLSGQITSWDIWTSDSVTEHVSCQVQMYAYGLSALATKCFSCFVVHSFIIGIVMITSNYNGYYSFFWTIAVKIFMFLWSMAICHLFFILYISNLLLHFGCFNNSSRECFICTADSNHLVTCY